MCKIMAITNISRIPKEDLDKHLLALRDIVCVANNDGFGYSLSWKDAVFSEKFTQPRDFKGMLKAVTHPKLSNLLFNTDADALSLGEYYEDVAPLAVIAHGRTSTNFKGYPEYSHPFYNESTKQAFIHNGIVDVPTHHPYKTETTNDSEYLAEVFWNEGITGCIDVTGYFAFMNLKPDGVMDVVKDDYANLYGAFSVDLDGYIFATTQYMITNYAEKFKITISDILKISDNMHAVIKGSEMLSLNAFDRVDKGFEMTWQEKQAFKDYQEIKHEKQKDLSKGTGNTYGKDVKELKQPKTIKGAHVGAGKTPEVADAGKDAAKTNKKDVCLLPLAKNTGAVGAIATKAKTETELLEDYLLAAEDRAFSKRLMGQADLEQAIANESRDAFYHNDHLPWQHYGTDEL